MTPLKQATRNSLIVWRTRIEKHTPKPLILGYFYIKKKQFCWHCTFSGLFNLLMSWFTGVNLSVLMVLFCSISPVTLPFYTCISRQSNQIFYCIHIYCNISLWLVYLLLNSCMWDSNCKNNKSIMFLLSNPHISKGIISIWFQQQQKRSSIKIYLKSDPSAFS